MRVVDLTNQIISLSFHDSDGRWAPPSEEEKGQMHRSEAQLWLCLRQLLLEPRLPHHYTIDDTRRTVFCRVRHLSMFYSYFLTFWSMASAFPLLWKKKNLREK